jgi:hypothetical protein
MRKLDRCRSWLAVLLALQGLLSLTLPVSASSAANISHAYHAVGQVTNGSIVSLDSQHAGYVQQANINNGSHLLGVAVSSTQSLLAVDAAPGMVQVATNGNADTLVSNLNGNIAIGDLISVSPFSGIGMKATPGQEVIGIAQSGFNPHSPGASMRRIAAKNSKIKEISVGYINLTIAINTNTGDVVGVNDLQKFIENLTGRVIPTYRIIISLIIAAIGLFVLATLVYSSIYGTIIAIGRNPLAKNSILHSLMIVLGMAILTVLVSGLIIFFLLY